MSKTLQTLQAAADTTLEQLSKRGADLDFDYQQSYELSTTYAARYLGCRSLFPSSPGLEANEIMATGRLEWLLRHSRSSLASQFTLEDVTRLLDCYQGDIFFPDQISSLASDLCDRLGIEMDAYADSAIAPLVRKLLALSPAQKLTLVDALEQVWNIDMHAGDSIADAFLLRGMALAEA